MLLYRVRLVSFSMYITSGAHPGVLSAVVGPGNSWRTVNSETPAVVVVGSQLLQNGSSIMVSCSSSLT